ncbi:hypothetical protein GE09DRAFT_1159764 [Coniochaeta sp. 2T2.1]|nr:hypothetical protein GE09DRAFT_1159764 [Coniochaeta sp. 2T2.1]
MRVALILTGLLSASAAGKKSSCNCKCFPGDDCWPTTQQWESLNQTVNGRLIATVPLAQHCHEPNFNDAACQRLRSSWQIADIHQDDSASVMAPFFANQSCDPFTPASQPCELGNYVRYAVDVRSTEDVATTVKFARQHNIRFVIRNTGHDYLGRSTGAGALSVWTHHLKDIEFTTFNDKYYSGPAVKVGAGVQAMELLAAAAAEGRVVVSGQCPTVGLAGGYTQGGGHSPLSTNFGLSADNTLEFEVVTASGNMVTASRTENLDLYWALSGSGAGNYGVVVSMTVKTHPDARVSSATLSFASDGISTETFFAAVDAFHAALPEMIKAGFPAVYYLTPASFAIAPVTAYNKTKAEVEAILGPFLATLDSLSITYSTTFAEIPSYHEHYVAYFGANSMVGVVQGGSRLVPLSGPATSAVDLSAAVRSILAQGVTWIGLGLDVSAFGKDSVNSVLSAWRQGPLAHSVIATPWSFEPADWAQMLKDKKRETETILPIIEAATPGSGSYMNEGDPDQPNFQDVFYGSAYAKLLKIKNAWDPEGFFYGIKAVGSEVWNVRGDGRMCRVKAAGAGGSHVEL